MHQDNNTLSASKFQNPIYLETPRLRKFYETTLTLLDSYSPLLGSSRPLILQNLLQSDCKCNPLSRINLSNAKLQKALMDPLGEIELNHSDGKTCIEDENEELGVGLLGVVQELKRKPNNQQIQQQQQSQQQQQQQQPEQNPKRIFKIYHCEKNSTKQNQINDIEPIEVNEIIEQMALSEDRDNSELQNEAKKRMRKSNQQLKILKVEFDRNGFWGKDKITAVANITGLSESQVYKWCWDQKKKQGEFECNSITKKIFKSKYKSNKDFQYAQSMEAINNKSQYNNSQQLNMEAYNNENQLVSKRLSFE